MTGPEDGTLAALLVAAGSALLLTPARGGLAPVPASPRPAAGTPPALPGVVPVLVPGVVLAALAAAALLPVGIGAWTAALLVLLAVRQERARSRRRQRLEQTRDRVDELVVLLAAELTAGRGPSDALAAVAAAVPGVADEAARLADLGGDVPASLRRAAERPGCAALADLGAALHVAAALGAPVAGIVDRLRRGLQAEGAVSREAAEQLAPVRATAHVLAVLPLAGIALGASLGVDSLSLLVSTGWGQACLVTAAGLVLAGLAWVDLIARRAVPTR